jgi:exonuclease III
MDLKLGYLNCRGFLSSKSGIKELLQDVQVLALQETWLAKQELHYLNFLDNYDSFGISKTDYSNGLFPGRNSGGVAFLWNRCLNTQFSIRPCDYNQNWLAGLDIIDKSTNVKLSIINVYLPFKSQDNVDEFLECFGVIQQILEEADTTRIMICGDFNCDPRILDVFGNTMSSFASDMGLFCVDVDMLPADTFTYVSDSWDTTSWIDHCLCTEDAKVLLKELSVDFGVTWSDHRPTLLGIDYSLSPSVSAETQLEQVVSNVRWHDQGVITEYRQRTEELLHNITINDVELCMDASCNNVSHTNQIDQLYNNIVEALKCSAPLARPCKRRVVPGWNEYVKDWKDASRESFLLWVDAGKPRHGPLYEVMKRCKSRFKYALRQCKHMEESCRADALAKNMSSKCYDAFWKEVKFVNAARVPLPNSIGDNCGSENIVDMWKDHYSQLFNLYGRRDPVTYNCNYWTAIKITPEEVADSIQHIPCSKSCGPDGLVGEHFKFANPSLYEKLAVLFSGMLVHGYIPSDMIKSILVPIVKNKCKPLSDKDNYRPVALSNVITKVIERIVLSKMNDYLWTLPNQFGFQKASSTDQCVYVFKELVNSYLTAGSTVYCCFLDASKAFDRVNHVRLMKLLKERGLPLYLVRFLDFWYLNQCMCIRWGSVKSEYFNVNNGVRQGGVLSPFLFNVYMNDLSVRLESLPCGLSYGFRKLNHIMYADDVALFAPSAGALQNLLNICNGFALEADLVYNSKKTVCMCITNGKFQYSLPCFHINDKQLDIVNEVKYLGHVITSDLSDDRDIDRQIRSVYCRVNMLVRKFSRCSDYVKCFLFKSFCSSMYCCSLWVRHRVGKLRRLFVTYNNAVRIFLRLPMRCSASLMYTMSDIPSPKCVIRKTCFGLYSRVRQSTKDVVKDIFEWSMVQRGSIALHWMQTFT